MSKSVNNEELRHAVLEVIALRFPTALPVKSIGRRVRDDAMVDFAFTDEETAAALEFLKGEQLADFTEDSLGSSRAWRATSAGVKRYERGS